MAHLHLKWLDLKKRSRSVKVKTDFIVWGHVFSWSVHFSFCGNQTIHMRYNKPNILQWKVNVKVMAWAEMNGHIAFIRYVYFFVSCQSAFFFRYSNFDIWPWNFEVKVIAKVEIDDHIWGPVFLIDIFVIRFVATRPFSHVVPFWSCLRLPQIPLFNGMTFGSS